MWGTSFAELARKASEVASSASNELVNIPSTGISLFNLDSILHQEENEQGSKRHQDRTTSIISSNTTMTTMTPKKDNEHVGIDKQNPPSLLNTTPLFTTVSSSSSSSSHTSNTNNTITPSLFLTVNHPTPTTTTTGAAASTTIIDNQEQQVIQQPIQVVIQQQEDMWDFSNEIDDFQEEEIKEQDQNKVVESSSSSSSKTTNTRTMNPKDDSVPTTNTIDPIVDTRISDKEQTEGLDGKEEVYQVMEEEEVPWDSKQIIHHNVKSHHEEVEMKKETTEIKEEQDQTTVDPNSNLIIMEPVISTMISITPSLPSQYQEEMIVMESSTTTATKNKNTIDSVVSNIHTSLENNHKDSSTMPTTRILEGRNHLENTATVLMRDDEISKNIQVDNNNNNNNSSTGFVEESNNQEIQTTDSSIPTTVYTVVVEQEEEDDMKQQIIETPVVEHTHEQARQHNLGTTSVEQQEEKICISVESMSTISTNTPDIVHSTTTITEPSVVVTKNVEITTPSSSSTSRIIPEADVIAQTYMLQLQRLQSQHELEIQEYQQRISTLENQLMTTNKKLQASTNSTNSISIHDKCLAQLRKLEREYTTQLQQKEDAFIQAQLVIENMDIELQTWKKNYQMSEDSTINYNQVMAENDYLKSNLSDLEKYKEQYETLKTRAKSVAMELRDKREEIKVTGDENKDLRAMVQSLQQNNSRMESQLTVQSRIVEERNEEIASLHSRMSSLQEEQQKSMQSYKKKAQESISSANARLTTLSQEKDVAEAALVEAQSECRRIMKQYQEERDRAILESQQTLGALLKQSEDLKQEKEEVLNRMTVLDSECKRYIEKFNVFEEKRRVEMENLDKVRHECSDLKVNVIALSNELAVEKVRSKELLLQIQNGCKESSVVADINENINEESHLLLEAKGEISRLQQELCQKHALIDELNAKINVYDLQEEDMDDTHEPMRCPRKSQFYFVMEKQAELDTIREEVNRLASIISDAESSKVAALDAMEVMRKRMEEAEARLRRHEKLCGSEQREASSLNHPSLVAKSDSVVNIEYLKNIILNYLHAKTLNERKTLLPVLCAVLELTGDERAHVLKSIEESADIQRIGVSVIENIQNKGIVHGLLGW